MWHMWPRFTAPGHGEGSDHPCAIARNVLRSTTAPPSVGVGGVPGNNASERLSVSAASKGRFYHPIVWGRTKKWMGCLAGSTTLVSKPGLLGRLSLNQRHPKAPLQTGAAPRRFLAFPPVGGCSGAWAVSTPAVGALVFYRRFVPLSGAFLPTEAGFDSRLPEHLSKADPKNEEGMWMLRFVLAAVLVALLAIPVK